MSVSVLADLWYYLFTIQQVISAEVLLTVSPWQ